MRHKFQKGYKVSEETRRKISKSHMGLRPSEESRKKMSLSHMGHKLSEERKAKFGFRGRKHTEESKMKMRKPKPSVKNYYGHYVSEETKRKISNALKGKVPTLETRKKLSEAFKGEKSKLWRGGVSSINKIIRASLECKLWRESVFKRDNYKCIWCGTKSNTKKDINGKWIIINADHVKPFALFPELRFAIDNGRTLCEPCHKTTDTYLWKNNLKKLNL